MSKQETNQKSKHTVERYYIKFLQYYEEKCPSLFHICYDPSGYHEGARKAFRFLLGLSLGLFLYASIISDLGLSERNGRLCGAALAALLSIGCTYSLQFRCVCLLTIPGFFGRAGRGVLKALILGYVIAGPVFNLSSNAKEVMRSFSCTGQLTYNLTRTKYDLMLAPFQQAMMNLNESAGEIRETLSSLNKVIKPIVEEIEGEDEEELNEDDEDELNEDDEVTDRTALPRKRRDQVAAEFFEDKYRRKISSRCENQLRRGSRSCREAFRGAYARCFESVTWVAGWVLCWPMKLTFVCNLVESLGGGKICDPEGKVQAGLGEGYATLKETRDRLNASLSEARISYELDTKSLVVAQARDAGRAAAGVMRDFEARKRFLDGLARLVKRCLSVVFLKIVLGASEYHAKYLADIEHDNVYVTPYFRRIDARRRARGAPSLLPLKKLERSRLLEPLALRQSRAERRHLFGQSAKLLLELASATTLVLLDRLLFELLDLVRRHARLEISQSGRHDVALEIHGLGLVAQLVRRLARGFSRRRRVSQLLSNEACLPRPARLPGAHLLGIYLGYLGVWLLLLLQAYGQRARRGIAAFFYRRREKRRVLHLYNESLRRRRGFLGWARGRAARAARARLLAPEARLWLALLDSRPGLRAWLRRLGWARLECAVCAEPEARRGPEHRLCRGPGCLAAYCEDCWRELGRSCWAAGCAPAAPSDDGDASDSLPSAAL